MKPFCGCCGPCISKAYLAVHSQHENMGFKWTSKRLRSVAISPRHSCPRSAWGSPEMHLRNIPMRSFHCNNQPRSDHTTSPTKQTKTHTCISVQHFTLVTTFWEAFHLMHSDHNPSFHIFSETLYSQPLGFLVLSLASSSLSLYIIPLCIV